MTTSLAPRTSDYVSLDEVLELFDRMTGYGLDPHSRTALEQLPRATKGKHVTDLRTTHELIHGYIQAEFKRRNGYEPKTKKDHHSVIRTIGANAQMQYDRDDLLRMMRTADVRNRLAHAFLQQTQDIGGLFIPAILADTHPLAKTDRTEART